MKLLYVLVSTITIVLTSATFTGALSPQQVKQIECQVYIAGFPRNKGDFIFENGQVLINLNLVTSDEYLRFCKTIVS